MNGGEAPPIIPSSLVHAGVKGLTARSVPQFILGTKVDATYPFSGKACSLDTSIRILHVRRTSSSTNTPTAGSISVESDPCRSLGFVREDTVNHIGGAFGRCVVVVRVPL